MEVALIADDLTGALDAAAPFVQTGRRVVVATGLDGIGLALASGAEVVAVSTASREIDPGVAAARAAEAAGRLSAALWRFKKIDSRLKGHIAVEVGAILGQTGQTRILVAPAIPSLGRRVAGGAVTGRGVDSPLPIAPVCPPGPALAIPDTATDADMDRALAAESPATMFVGARGLAEALVRRLDGTLRPPAEAPRLPGPVVLIVGSRDPITLAQVAALRAARPALLHVAAPSGMAELPSRPADLILQTVPGTPPASGAEVAARLAAHAARLAQGAGTLVLTGGETAQAVLDRLGIRALRLLGEVEPAVPLAQPLDFPGAPLIVTKSGGLGSAGVLADLYTLRAPGAKAG